MRRIRGTFTARRILRFLLRWAAMTLAIRYIIPDVALWRWIAFAALIGLAEGLIACFDDTDTEE